jgi:hypothetical protein
MTTSNTDRIDPDWVGRCRTYNMKIIFHLNRPLTNIIYEIDSRESFSLNVGKEKQLKAEKFLCRPSRSTHWSRQSKAIFSYVSSTEAEKLSDINLSAFSK